jgi:hypothetical protein
MKNKKISKDDNLEDLVESEGDEEEDSKKRENSKEEEFFEEDFFDEDAGVDDSISEVDSSPSLRQAAVSGVSGLENQIFVSGGSELDENRNEDDSFRYDIIKNEEDEKKYTSYDPVRDVAGIEMENLGRDVFRDAGKEVGFVSSMDVENKKEMYEKRYEVKKVDVDNLGRENIFEARMKKYKERPKSY